MLQDLSNAPLGFRPSKSAPCSPLKPIGIFRSRSESFHVTHKIPIGDTPYVKAKHAQLVEKNPEKAIPLFWSAINAGDRVDSALKDMAIVMKQQNRAEEAIEAIKSLRSRCSNQAQESLDNILLDLYKKCGRLEDQIALLKHKLFLIQQGVAFNGKQTKTARSQGRKFQLTVNQEATRLLGNLGWALMQQNTYIEAEDAYVRALLIAPDSNKLCNLGICLMKQGRLDEAKETLVQVRPAMGIGPKGVDSHLKAFERAQQMLRDLESETMNKGGDRVEQTRLFEAFLGSSAIWQPQPCKEPSLPPTLKPQENFANLNRVNCQVPHRSAKTGFIPFGNSLNIDAPPFYSLKSERELTNLGGLKRARPINAEEFGKAKWKSVLDQSKSIRRCSPVKENHEWDDLLPDTKAFEEAILATAVDSTTDDTGKECQMKVNKRLRVFEDITLSLSPRV